MKVYKSMLIGVLLGFLAPHLYSQNAESRVVENTPVEVSDTTSQRIDRETSDLIMQIFDGQDISLIKIKADQLITSGKDPIEQGEIASYIFDYYSKSKYMGYEEIALYVADNYFLNGRLKWPFPESELAMKMFAEFNRQSMIGLLSPELNLTDTIGREVSLRRADSRYKVVYFYDDECQVCNIYTAQIMRYLKDFNSGSLSIFRVYTQNSRERWTNYIKKIDARFPVSKNVTIYDVWDPDFTSDFQRKFGVVSTPQLLLLNRDNYILGRKLDANALSQLIDIDFNTPTKLQTFIDQLFTSLLPYDQTQEIDTTLVISTIDDLYQKSKGDTSLFQETLFTTYQYLKRHQEYDFQKGAAYIGNRYIAQMPQMWSDANFSEKKNSKGRPPLGLNFESSEEFVEATKNSVEQFYRNQLGKPTANLYLNLPDKSSFSIYDSKGKFTILYFYNMECTVCEVVSKEMVKTYREYKDKGVEILAIYTGSPKKRKEWLKYIADGEFEWINLYDKKGSQEMFEKYNLSGLPAIYLLDEDKNTLAKEVNPKVLNEILEYLTND